MTAKNLIVFLLLTFTSKSFANMDCLWTSSRKGIYLEYVAPCEQNYKKFVDSILRQIVSELNRKDTTQKIEVYVNSQSLFYRETSNSNFIAISYDLLGRMNDEAIFKYYWDKQMKYSIEFNTRLTPVDINFSKDTTKQEFGTKIIFNTDYRLGEPNWNDLRKLIIYSINNITEIKTTQIRDTIGHCCNGYFVSLLTIDSTQIKNILYPKPIKKVTSDDFNNFYLVIIILTITIIATRLIIRKHSS